MAAEPVTVPPDLHVEAAAYWSCEMRAAHLRYGTWACDFYNVPQPKTQGTRNTIERRVGNCVAAVQVLLERGANVALPQHARVIHSAKPRSLVSCAGVSEAGHARVVFKISVSESRLVDATLGVPPDADDVDSCVKRLHACARSLVYLLRMAGIEASATTPQVIRGCPMFKLQYLLRRLH